MIAAVFALASALPSAPGLAQEPLERQDLNFGIEVTPNDAIVYRGLDLTISTRQIHSISTFRNASNAPLHASTC